MSGAGGVWLALFAVTCLRVESIIKLELWRAFFALCVECIVKSVFCRDVAPVKNDDLAESCLTMVWFLL